MTLRYVGSGGNDANSGLSWAARKLTLNGVEDTPVVAGDTVYVAPGVYREMLTCDVSGGAGSPITYIGDVSGEHTDGVGGVVRITGSDNDQTVTRASCITGTTRSYRTFRGFMLDSCSGSAITGGLDTRTNWIIEDCLFQGSGINLAGANQAAWTLRRCSIWVGAFGACIIFQHSVTVNDTGHVIENCVLSGYYGVQTVRVGGITIKDSTILRFTQGISVTSALAGGQSITVNNCIIVIGGTGLSATVLGDIIEDYNLVYGNITARTNVAIGANSNTYPPLLDLGILHAGASQISGFRFPPPLFGALSQWSQVRAIADTGAATEDVLGLTRPVTAGKRSWGAVQYVDMARDTATVRTGTASKKLADAGRDQIYVPTTAVSTVFSVYVYREANYAGVNPQMIVKQPGQADTVVTDAGAAAGWNLLTTTLTPAASPGYVVVELVSNNTAAAGNYVTYFDDLTVV